MILDWANQTTEDIFNGIDSTAVQRVPRTIVAVAVRNLDMLHAASKLDDLLITPANRLEQLKGKWSGYHSIRIDDVYRLVFKWIEGNAQHVRMTDHQSKD